MVGLRVLDVGGLLVWLVWFSRLRDPDDEIDDDGPGGEPEPPSQWPPPVPGDRLPLPDAEPWPRRRRDHAGDREPSAAPGRRGRPRRAPVRQ